MADLDYQIHLLKLRRSKTYDLSKFIKDEVRESICRQHYSCKTFIAVFISKNLNEIADTDYLVIREQRLLIKTSCRYTARSKISRRFLGRVIGPRKNKDILSVISRIKILLHLASDLGYEHLYLLNIFLDKALFTFSSSLIFQLRIDKYDFRDRTVLRTFRRIKFMSAALIIDFSGISAH